MANYYVSSSRGDDTTGNGSVATPWKTIGKAVGPSPAITLSGTGDVLYIEPGLYRETVAFGLSPTSGGPFSIIGDGDGAGFLAGGYSTPATGLVEWRGWSDDSTLINAVMFQAFGKSYVTVQGLKMIGAGGGNVACFDVGGASWSDWTFRDCIFVGNYTKPVIGWIATTTANALNVTFERCEFVTSGSGIDFRLPLNSAEYNTNVLVQNCRFFYSSNGLRYNKVGGSGSFFATGLRVQGCSFYFCTVGVSIAYGSGDALTTPNYVYGCNFQFCGTGVSAGQTSQLTENGNVLFCSAERVNVSAGANSRDKSTCPAWEIEDGRLYGVGPKPFGTPSAVSPLNSMGSYGTPPAVDLYNRARPEGYGTTGQAAGALALHDNGVKNTVYHDSGAGSTACMALVGPASQDRPILVDAASTTVSVKVRWDGNHGNTNKPQAILLANPEIGYAGQTKTATTSGGSGSTPNSYETLTFTGFTPSAAGVVMLRMVSRSAAGNGVAYFDSIDVA